MADAIGRLSFAAEAFRAAIGRWPDAAALHARDPSLPRVDVWGRPFACGRDGDGSFVIRSCGRDGRAGTTDDVVWRAAPDPAPAR